jgi:hypothetical protein
MRITEEMRSTLGASPLECAKVRITERTRIRRRTRNRIRQGTRNRIRRRTRNRNRRRTRNRNRPDPYRLPQTEPAESTTGRLLHPASASRLGELAQDGDNPVDSIEDSLRLLI